MFKTASRVLPAVLGAIALAPRRWALLSIVVSGEKLLPLSIVDARVFRDLYVAIFKLFDVHRNGDIGSPRVSGSTSPWRSSNVSWGKSILSAG